MRVALVLLLCSVGCAAVYPPVETTPAAAAAAAPSPSAEGGAPAPAPAARGARIQLLGAEDPEYIALVGAGGDRSLPDAPERLLVLKDGAVVADLGIRMVPADEQATAPVQERVALADDASSAVIVRQERKANAREQTTVTWVPAEDPGKAWKKPLAPGNRVPLALPIPRGRGLVLVSDVPDAPDDVRVYDAKGAEVYRMAGAPERVIELRGTDSGRFVAADLAYVTGKTSPGDRAIWIYDVASRTAWTHPWKYGDDDEVTAWKLLEDGTLETDTAEHRFTYGPGNRLVDRKKREL
ncbi:MAG TPA: hypothetical protein VFV75_12700 [Candidatus Polarisedimenticolaceae bacterium]|nr:hypothetical protein [Candidatus Polarisedimenticolaceae bacterium]